MRTRSISLVHSTLFHTEAPFFWREMTQSLCANILRTAKWYSHTHAQNRESERVSLFVVIYWKLCLAAAPSVMTLACVVLLSIERKCKKEWNNTLQQRRKTLSLSLFCTKRQRYTFRSVSFFTECASDEREERDNKRRQLSLRAAWVVLRPSNIGNNIF
jgi:hypothetical protein